MVIAWKREGREERRYPTTEKPACAPHLYNLPPLSTLPTSFPPVTHSNHEDGRGTLRSGAGEGQAVLQKSSSKAHRQGAGKIPQEEGRDGHVRAVQQDRASPLSPRTQQQQSAPEQSSSHHRGRCRTTSLIIKERMCFAHMYLSLNHPVDQLTQRSADLLSPQSLWDDVQRVCKHSNMTSACQLDSVSLV
jgi:hypothetical protein